MSLITKAAYLKLCPMCGFHGVIVYADGTESPAFFTRVDGLLALSEGVKEGRLASDEMEVVEKSICEQMFFSSREDPVFVRILAGLGMTTEDADDLAELMHEEGTPQSFSVLLPMQQPSMVS